MNRVRGFVLCSFLVSIAIVTLGPIVTTPGRAYAIGGCYFLTSFLGVIAAPGGSRAIWSDVVVDPRRLALIVSVWLVGLAAAIWMFAVSG